MLLPQLAVLRPHQPFISSKKKSKTFLFTSSEWEQSSFSRIAALQSSHVRLLDAWKIPTQINSFPFPVILQHHIFAQQVSDTSTSGGHARTSPLITNGPPYVSLKNNHPKQTLNALVIFPKICCWGFFACPHINSDLYKRVTDHAKEIPWLLLAWGNPSWSSPPGHSWGFL